MPSWDYSIKGLDPDKTARVAGRDLRVSPKAAREICRVIRGMRLGKAKEYLQQVIERKKSVPFKRHQGGVGHRSDVSGFHAGRYPVKASREMLALLEQLEVNAEYKGLSPEDLRIIHAAAQRGMKIKRYIPRAFGRSSPRFQQLTHIEIAAEEVVG
ncbi:MAG: 50S ribosomal protein L22 [Candidatus Bathyarchaeia archaeon]